MTLLILAATLGLSACGGDEKDAASADGGSTPAEAVASTPASTPEAAESESDADSDDAASCKEVETPKPKSADVSEPKGKLDAGKTYTAVLKTSCGEIRIKLDQKNNPKTANVFAHLVRENYYDGTIFHRVVKGWVAQGGDPLGNGTGGPSWSVVEAPKSSAKYTRGVVAMAKAGNEPAGATGSQFYIVIADDAGLPTDYSIAGEVTSVMDAVDAIDGLSTGQDGPPSRPIVLEKAFLEVK